MGKLFVDNVSDILVPGAQAVELADPVIIEGLVLGYMGLVFVGEWGPINVVSEPDTTQDFVDMYFPRGAPRDSKGYHALMGRKKLALRPVRILPADADKATRVITITGGGGGTLTITAKYEGTLGNSITVMAAAATDGDAAHRDITVELTDAVTGTTSETFRNVALDEDMTLRQETADSLLVDSFAWAGTGTTWPAAETSGTAMSTGSNGTGSATAALYDAAFDLLKAHPEVYVVTTDEIPSGIKSATVGYLCDHLNETRNRIGVFQCDDGASRSTVKAEAATIRSALGSNSDRAVYCATMMQAKDDAGDVQVTPFATYVASALAAQEPQQSHAVYGDPAVQFYANIVGVSDTTGTLDWTDETIRAEFLNLGLCLPHKIVGGRFDGQFTAMHDRTLNISTLRARFAVTRRIRDYLARSIVARVQEFTNKVGYRTRFLEIKGLIDQFLKAEVTRESDGKEPRVTAYATGIAGNSPASLATGLFSINIDAATPAPMEKIALLFNVGPTVEVVDRLT